MVLQIKFSVINLILMANFCHKKFKISLQSLFYLPTFADALVTLETLLARASVATDDIATLGIVMARLCIHRALVDIIARSSITGESSRT